MYFSKFPLILYDAKGAGDFEIATNMLKRVALRTGVRTNTLLYDTYDVKEGERPEDIAFKLYGDPELHWVVLFVNNVTDRYHGWPMSTPQFLKFVNEKYADPDALHHYEIAQTSGKDTIKIDIGTDNTDYPSASTVTNFEYEQDRQDTLRQIRLLDPIYVSQLVNEFEGLMGASIL
jgi:hypothetical protein